MLGKRELFNAAYQGDVIQVIFWSKILKGNVNVKNHYGETPLYIAAVLGHESVITTLIRIGANPNSSDIHGNTPMHMLFKYQHINIGIFAVCYGGNVHYINKMDKRPIDFI